MTALIIGGSTDIGINLANYLQEKGYQVIVTYNHNPIKIANVKTIKLDITDETSVDKCFANLIKEYKSINYLFNLAAISMDNLVQDKSIEEFMHVLEVNLGGTFIINKIYSKYMSDGFIINMSSTDGIDTFSEYNIDYATSKSGIITLSKCMALSTQNKVICLCPNWIDSKTTNEIDKDYLKNELKRISQSRLITISELVTAIDKIIHSPFNSGDVFRIDVRRDKLWITKV